MTSTLEVATAFARAGFSVFRASADGSKAPLGRWKHATREAAHPLTVRTWFADGYPGVGIMCGAVSGNLEMLEFEGRAMTEGLHEQATDMAESIGASELLERVWNGYRERTPSGGVHLLYRVDGSPVPGNTALAKRPSSPDELAAWKAKERAKAEAWDDEDRTAKRLEQIDRMTAQDVPQVLIETRGEDGFTITAPSHGPVHPSGKPYVLESGGVDTVPTITAEEHKLLHDLLRGLDQMTPEVRERTTPAAETPAFAQPTSAAPSGSGLKPGEDYNARGSFCELLTRHGWERDAVRPDGVEEWRRPGKDEKEGISATVGYGGDKGCFLYVFSTSTVFAANTAYSLFAAYTLLEHGGDYSAAARALRAAGYGDQSPAPGEQTEAPAGAEAAVEEPVDRYPVLDWHEVWQTARADVEWLCEPLLEAGRVVALFSPAKTGKSLLTLEIAAAIATGRAVLGNPARAPRRVLYVDLENSLDDLRQRLEDLGYGPDDLENLRYLSFPSLPVLDSPLGGAHLLAVARQHDAALVVLDTVSRIIGGEEDKADTFRALYRHAVMPLKAEGRAVLRLDHSGKELSRGQRGSSGKADDVDAVWSLSRRNPTTFDLRRTHSRTNHGAEHLTLTRLADPLRHELPGGLGLPDMSNAVEVEVDEIVRQLDVLGVPRDAGRPTCREALNNSGIKAKNVFLEVAVRKRRALPPEAGAVADATTPNGPAPAPASTLPPHAGGQSGGSGGSRSTAYPDELPPAPSPQGRGRAVGGPGMAA